MDGAASGILESVTHKSLHAQNFSRASSKASHVLTDLTSRYFSLVASTCARYAEHAGRTSVTMADAMNALTEVGISLEELADYAIGEGIELSNYAPLTARRQEELSLLRGDGRQYMVVRILTRSLWCFRRFGRRAKDRSR